MNKNIEWLKEEVDRYLSYEGVNEARNALMFAKGVINQLEEPEKPVIPQFMADWIERQIKFGHEDVFISMTRQFIFPSSEIKNMGIRNFELEEVTE